MKRKEMLGFIIFTAFLLLTFYIPNNYSVKAQLSEPDYWPTTDWQTATPESQGMTSSWFHQMEAYLQQVNWGFTLRSVLIVRHGYLVYENYMGLPDRENDTNNIYSCTKSITSSLIGIAVSQGFLDVDDNMVDFFSDLTIANLDSRKEAITVEHLLTMTSGLPWDESTYPFGHPNNDWDRMTISSNWVQFVLDRPMDYTPGAQWVYNTGGSHLLSAIVTRATNTPTISFAETNLFAPLGITDYTWLDDPQDIVNGGSSLSLRPRDMAKFGFLYLQGGTWDGAQILPQSWVTASSARQTSVDAQTEYGYQWWIHPTIDAFAAHGYLNQHIYVFPDHDMVVVFSAHSTNMDALYLLENYIIPATTPSVFALQPLIIAGVVGIIVVIVIATIVILRQRRTSVK